MNGKKAALTVAVASALAGTCGGYLVDGSHGVGVVLICLAGFGLICGIPLGLVAGLEP